MMTFELDSIIAHRGASAYAPENTLSAFQKAYDLGLRWIEIDVQLSRCGQLVVIHDDDLARTTNGNGVVTQTDYREIALLDAGSWFASRFINERVPLLYDVIQFVCAHAMQVNIEIKVNPDNAAATAAAIFLCLQQHWPNTQAWPLLSSSQPEALAQIRTMSADVALGLISDKWIDDWQTLVERYRLYSLHFNHRVLSAKRMAQIKQASADLAILAYTVNDAHKAHTLFDLGVASVFSDYPDLIKGRSQ